MSFRIINTNVLDGIPLPDASVHCCVTSPPYLWQRDYGVDGQIGLEDTIEEYLEKIVRVFREVHRVLHPTGTLWVNMGDSYCNDTKWGGTSGGKNEDSRNGGYVGQRRKRKSGLPPKSLIGVPWRVAFALQSDGWILRAENIWHNPCKKPESVNDRPSRDHENVFLFSKRSKYFYDPILVRQPGSPKTLTVRTNPRKGTGVESSGEKLNVYHDRQGRYYPEGRNLSTVWSIATEQNHEPHFAPYPSMLPEICILAGTSEHGCCPRCLSPWVRIVKKHKGENASFNGSDFTGKKTAAAISAIKPIGKKPRTALIETLGWKPSCKCEKAAPIDCIVFDPFSGTGTTGVAALRNGRDYIGCELNDADCLRTQDKLRTVLRNSVGDLFISQVEQFGLFETI